jgi:hypothetical protein
LYPSGEPFFIAALIHSNRRSPELAARTKPLRWGFSNVAAEFAPKPLEIAKRHFSKLS